MFITLELKKGYSINLSDFGEIPNWSYSLFIRFFQINNQSIKRNIINN